MNSNLISKLVTILQIAMEF